jgi:serine protease Do
MEGFMSLSLNNGSPPSAGSAPKWRRIIRESGQLKFGATALALFVLLGMQIYPPVEAAATSEQNITGQAVSGPILPSFSGLVERVKPAVVSINVKTSAAAAKMASDEEAGDDEADAENPFRGTPLERFFEDPKSHKKNDKGKNDKGKNGDDRPVLGQGSGFFISPDGYLVTNNHVVEGALKVDIVTESGEILPARVIGTDPSTDLALVKVDAKRTFAYVNLSHSEVKVGDWVIALGNPFGLGGTVTAGIVSGHGRDIGMGSYDDFLQIDAPVNKGNSGGPTFNQHGEVVGVNTAIFSPSGGSVGIAFAIPAHTVEIIVSQLKEKGRVSRGWLGVLAQPITPELAESLDLKFAKGALITSANAGSPAEKAGIKKGDVVSHINGVEIKDGRDLARKIAILPPATEVKITIVNQDRQRTASIKLGELPEEKKAQPVATKTAGEKELRSLGVSVAPAKGSSQGNDAGVTVVRVDPEGRAADLGLAQGDVILEANGSAISTGADLERALKAARGRGKNNALGLIQRGNDQVFIALPTDQS